MNAKKIKVKVKQTIGRFIMGVTTIVFSLRAEKVYGEVLFKIYRSIISTFNLSAFSLVNAKAYEKCGGMVEIINIETERKGVAGNIIVAGKNDSVILKESPIPDLQLYKYEGVCIRGDSDVIVDIKNECVISDAGYNVPKDEEVVDGLLYRTRKNVCLLRDNMKHKKTHIKAGIMISGKFSQNYYHLLYENFIRIIYFEKLNIPENIPIIADRCSLSIPSCRRIFDILNKDFNRKVILIDNDKIYFFDTIFCLSRINKFPADITNPIATGVEYLYYAPALTAMRNRLLQFKSDKVFPRRVFISRAGRKRRSYNEDDVFAILKTFGFERVVPELLTFEEQMSLFYGAEYIVGGSGAAFSNLLFASEKSITIIFTRGSLEKISELPVFNTLANVNGGKVLYFPNKQKDMNNLHSDYTIDCKLFADTIKKVIL